MSYARLVLSVAGGLGACIKKRKCTKASTWAPAVSWARFRIIILLINLYYDAINRKEEED